jgi:hypothetical protein
VRAPWFWLALTYLVLAVGSFVLYGGADYPGLFADSPGALEAGPERDSAIEAWEDRYFEVGLPFAIAAAITFFAWLLALGQRWLLLTALAAAAVLALAALDEQAAALLVIFLVPALVLLAIPWQVAAVVVAAVAVAALALRPPGARLGLQVAALYVALSGQVAFTALSFLMSRGTFS